MMRGKKHIIQKLVVDLEYNGDARGLELENMVSRWCREVLLPYLENMLDKEEATDVITRISKIEIELDTDSKEEWLNILLKNTGIALKDKLDVLQHFASHDLSVQNMERKAGFEEGPSNLVRLHSSEDFFQALVFYLKNANLPWWWDYELSLRKTFNDWLASSSNEQLPMFIKEAIRDKQAAKRFTMLCEPALFPAILTRLHAGRQGFVKKLIPVVNKLAAYFPADKENETKILFETALVQFAILPDNEFVLKLLLAIHEWFEHVCQEYELKTKAAAGIKWKKELFSHVAVTLDEIKKMMKVSFGSVFPEADIGSSNEIRNSIVTQPATSEMGKDRFDAATEKFTSSNEEIEKNKAHEETKEAPGEEAIYIINAGLILLAPLLPTLFKRLELLTDGKIEYPSLAVMLLHYICYGNEDASEYEMPLYKILCGLPQTQAVNTRIRLEAKQKEEAGELLRSVIEFWKVLKDTSADALRASFLQRNGKLLRVNKEWKLMVEQKPYDMLLQQLPWSIQMIKLSWMDELVRTEWN
jgi:hypothetical protein